MRIVAVNFSANGTKKGTVRAEKDDGEFLGFEDLVNFSVHKEQVRLENSLKSVFANEYAAELAQDPDYFGRKVRDLAIEVDRMANRQWEEQDQAQKDDKKSQATQLVDLAAGCEFWHTPEGNPFVTIEVDGHKENWSTRAKAFRGWLSNQFYRSYGKSPGTQAIYDALSVLDGQALYEGEEHAVYIRVAEVADAIYIDLANDAWEAIRVTASGWEVISDAPVRFRRARGMLPLPIPKRGGSVHRLRALLNISQYTDDDWALFLGCLVQAMRGRGPYPILVVYGGHGSTKSTVSRVFRRLIDPNKADLRTPPKDERDMMIQASNSWVLAYDNLSHIPDWRSDALCRLSTGGGMGTRELYSDDEERIFEGQRPIVLNGIEEISNRPDLMDRAVILTLKALDKKRRKSERVFWSDFDAIHAELLGGLLDGVATGLKNEGSVDLEELPRMADFAIWATATEPGLGMAPGTFLAAYHANRAQANEATLEASVLAGYIQQIVEAQQGDWTGTFADLLRQLVSMASEKDTKDKAWPTHANVLSSRMRALAPNLRAAGIEVTQSDKDSPRRNGLKRWVRIHIIEVDPDKNNGEKDRPHRPHRPPEHESGEKSGQSEDAGASASSASSSTQNTVNSCSQSMPPDDEDDMDAEFSDYSSDPTYQTSELSETPRTSDGEDDEDVLLI